MSTASSVDATQYYANRQHTLSFVETIERDMRNLGSGVDPVDPMIISYQWDATSKIFEFVTLSDTTEYSLTAKVKYVVTPVDSVADSDESHYQVSRWIMSGGAYSQDGGSAPTLLNIEISLLDATGTQVAAGSIEDTRIIDVTIQATSPLGDENIVGVSTWQSRYRPTNLGLKDL